MKALPYLLLVSMFLLACQPLRTTTTDTRTTTDSTTVITHRDTMHVTVRDTITHHTTAHVTVRDTTYTREHIVIRYDRETGQPIERTEDRDICQLRTLDSLYQRMLVLQHSLDSLTAAEHAQHITSHRDSINNQTVTESGDAARTPWQSFLHFVSQQAWTILFICALTILLVLAINKLLRRFLP